MEAVGIALAVAGLLCTIAADGTAFLQQMRDNSGQLDILFEQFRGLARLVEKVADHVKRESCGITQLQRSHSWYEIELILKTLQKRLPGLQADLEALMEIQPATWLGRRLMQRERRHIIKRIKELRDLMQSEVAAIQTHMLMAIEYVHPLHSVKAPPLLTWSCSNSNLQAIHILQQAPSPPIEQIEIDIEGFTEPDMETKRTEEIFNAVEGRDLETVRRLLRNEKLLSGRNTSCLAKAKRNGRTLLDCALDGKPTWDGRYELIDLLLSHGAEVAIRGKKLRESQRVMKMMWN